MSLQAWRPSFGTARVGDHGDLSFRLAIVIRVKNCGTSRVSPCVPVCPRFVLPFCPSGKIPFEACRAAAGHGVPSASLRAGFSTASSRASLATTPLKMTGLYRWTAFIHLAFVGISGCEEAYGKVNRGAGSHWPRRSQKARVRGHRQNSLLGRCAAGGHGVPSASLRTGFSTASSRAPLATTPLKMTDFIR